MKTYKEFNEAAALAIPALKAAGYVIPALGGILKGVKAITNRETGLSDSEKRRVGELMDMIRRKKEEKIETDISNYRKKKRKEKREEGIADRPKKQVDEENKHRDAKLFYQYKQLQDPQDPTKQKIKDALMLRLKKA